MKNIKTAMVGNIQYTGTGTYHVAFDDRVRSVTKGVWINVPLSKAKELIDTGNFMPDEETKHNLYVFGGRKGDGEKIDGVLKGKDCFIIGGGNSLRGFDFSILDNKFTIAVNHTVIYYPKAKACIFLDGDFLDKKNNEARKFLMEYKGMVFCSYRTTYHNENKKAIPFYTNMDKITDSFEKGIYGTRLTGIAALSLAIIMNPDNIYLLGFDLDTKADKIHFYDTDYNNEHGYRSARIQGHLNDFKKFVPYKDKIFNLNLNSKVNCFGFKNIKDVIGAN